MLTVTQLIDCLRRLEARGQGAELVRLEVAGSSGGLQGIDADRSIHPDTLTQQPVVVLTDRSPTAEEEGAWVTREHTFSCGHTVSYEGRAGWDGPDTSAHCWECGALDTGCDPFSEVA